MGPPPSPLPPTGKSPFHNHSQPQTSIPTHVPDTNFYAPYSESFGSLFPAQLLSFLLNPFSIPFTLPAPRFLNQPSRRALLLSHLLNIPPEFHHLLPHLPLLRLLHRYTHVADYFRPPPSWPRYTAVHPSGVPRTTTAYVILDYREYLCVSSTQFKLCVRSYATNFDASSVTPDKYSTYLSHTI